MSRGSTVGFATPQRDRVTRWVAMDGPLPGIGPWDQLTANPRLWHVGFGGPDMGVLHNLFWAATGCTATLLSPCQLQGLLNATRVCRADRREAHALQLVCNNLLPNTGYAKTPDMERLVAGRERIYLDHLWNDFGADPAAFGEETRAHYAALYGLPGGMRAGFAQFAAFARDAADNRGFLAQGKLTIPVLAVGGEASGGAMVETLMRFVADHVEGAVVPDAAHWQGLAPPHTSGLLERDCRRGRPVLQVPTITKRETLPVV